MCRTGLEPRGPRRDRDEGGLVFAGGGEDALYAFDKQTGRELWSTVLAERSTATPMTYQSSRGRQFVLIAPARGRRRSSWRSRYPRAATTRFP